MSPYVDGSDFFFIVDGEKQTAEMLWEDESIGDPKFHGGEVASAIEWVKQLGEPVYSQLDDPFLTAEQQTALERRITTSPNRERSDSIPDRPNGNIEDWL